MLPVVAAVTALAAFLSGRDPGDDDLLEELGLGQRQYPYPPGQGVLRLGMREPGPESLPRPGPEVPGPGENPAELSVLQLMEVTADRPLFVVRIDDEGYVIEAWEGEADPEDDPDPSEAVDHLKDETRKVTVTRYDGLPRTVQERMDRRDWDFSDGYEANQAIEEATRQYPVEEEEVYDYEMTRDREFEDWSDDEKSSYRDHVLYEAQRKAPRTDGLRIFFPTNRAEDWQEAVGQLVVDELEDDYLAGLAWSKEAVDEASLGMRRLRWGDLPRLAELDYDALGDPATAVVELLIESGSEEGRRSAILATEDDDVGKVLEADFSPDNAVGFPGELAEALDEHAHGSPTVVPVSDDAVLLVLPMRRSPTPKVRVVAVHPLGG